MKEITLENYNETLNKIVDKNVFEEFIKKYKYELTCFDIFKNQNMTEKLLEKHFLDLMEDTHWDCLIKVRQLSCGFLDKFEYLYTSSNWHNISTHQQNLDDNFIRKYFEKLDKKYLLLKELSKEIIYEFSDVFVKIYKRLVIIDSIFHIKINNRKMIIQLMKNESEFYCDKCNYGVFQDYIVVGERKYPIYIKCPKCKGYGLLNWIKKIKGY